MTDGGGDRRSGCGSRVTDTGKILEGDSCRVGGID